MNKFTRNHQHQRQHVSRKKIIFICAISLCFVAICSVVFFNFIHIARTQATVNNPDTNVFIVAEQSLVNEKEIPAPVVIPQMNRNANVILAKRAKAVPVITSQDH